MTMSSVYATALRIGFAWLLCAGINLAIWRLFDVTPPQHWPIVELIGVCFGWWLVDFVRRGQ